MKYLLRFVGIENLIDARIQLQSHCTPPETCAYLCLIIFVPKHNFATQFTTSLEAMYQYSTLNISLVVTKCKRLSLPGEAS